MNTPVPATPVIQQNIALDRLSPSPTNPRKRFDEAKLKELAESIKTQGVLQPILVRTWNVGMVLPHGKVFGDMIDAYEVIAGERRYRAATLAGLAEVPCFIRELTDLQVLHAQVIENLQRDDLHPIEEAEGYEKLLLQKTVEGKPFNADMIAAEVGKSRGYVYGRLKLLALCQEARDAFFSTEIDASTALLIARIPTQKLQIEALEHISEGEMTFRMARDYVQRTFMLDLASAPFAIKDAKLLAKAGACTDCPKRTGNQPELFDDVKSKDVCTDTACFELKKAAHATAALALAEKNGDEVIRLAEAKKLIGSKWQLAYGLSSLNLAQLDDEIPDDEDERTWRAALDAHNLLTPIKGKQAIHKTIIENPFESGIIEAVDIKAATQALTDAGFKITQNEETLEKNQTRTNDIAERNKKFAEEKAQKEAEVAQTNVTRRRLFDALRAKIAADMSPPKPHVADGLYRILAEAVFEYMVDDYRNAEEIVKLYMPEANFETEEDQTEEFSKFIASLTTQQHFLLIMDCMMAKDLLVNQWNVESSPDLMLAVAKEIGIDADAIEKAAITETKPSKKTTKKGAKA